MMPGFRRNLDAEALAAICAANAKADLAAEREARIRRWQYIAAGILAAIVALECLTLVLQS